MFAFRSYLTTAITAGAIIGSGALGYKFGSDGANVKCLDTNLNTAIKYAEGWKSAVAASEQQIKAQADREIERAKREAVSKSRQVKERNEYEAAYRNLATSLGSNRLSCDTPDHIYRMLNDAIDRINSSIE